MSQADHYVRDDVRAFLDFLKSQDGPQIYELPLDEARAAPRAMGEFADAPARALPVVRDLTCPGPAGPIPLRLFDAQAERGPGPAIVFFHGGGFVIGDLDSYASLCSEIAAVEEHDRRARAALGLRIEQPQRDRTGRAGAGEIAHHGQLARRSVGELAHGPGRRARFVERQFVDLRPVLRLQEVE